MAFVVVCLEGAHGSGKTQLTHAWRDAGFPVLDEAFMGAGPTLLDRQSLFCETAWVCSWISRVMSKVIELRDSGSPHRVIVADRSPFSAVLYSRTDGQLLEPVIRQFLRDLRESAGVEVVCAHLRTPRELLWSRIQARLRVEPDRIALREDREEWMDEVLRLYDSMAWDVTVPNDEAPIWELRDRVLHALGGVAVSPGAQAALLALSASLASEAHPGAPSAATPEKGSDRRRGSDGGVKDIAAGLAGVRMALHPAEVSPTQPLTPGALSSLPSTGGSLFDLRSAGAGGLVC